ncbi:hypothetical protein CDAR_470491 [Caerostris darwini]|uniref:Uncharacterized protein n=1 Tax=Caerostris darwini TaxID=1538125 RepID=A0AAV4VHD2_9ARAC|nr:hypothetical protein CDAR_470491 [Caerostris darwini]
MEWPWQRKRPPALSSTERVRRWREKQKELKQNGLVLNKEQRQWRKGRPPPLTASERVKRWREKKKLKKLLCTDTLPEGDEIVLPRIQFSSSLSDATEGNEKQYGENDFFTQLFNVL